MICAKRRKYILRIYPSRNTGITNIKEKPMYISVQNAGLYFVFQLKETSRIMSNIMKPRSCSFHRSKMFSPNTNMSNKASSVSLKRTNASSSSVR